MGCDIHLVLEQKNSEGRWVGLHSFNGVSDARRRNYALFTALANVRAGGGESGPKPKGLPDDASELTHLLFDDDVDLHSHTWWPLNDALPLFAAHHLGAELLEPGARHKVMSIFGLWDEEDPNQYRLCIAFDN